MIDPAQFIARWKFSDLTRATYESVQNFNISDISKNFLVNVGIPTNPLGDGLTCDLSDEKFINLVHLPKYNSSIFRPYYIIGSWGENDYLCINSEDGMIRNTADSIEYWEIMNSSIEQMAASFLVYRESRAELFLKYTDEAKFVPRYLPTGELVMCPEISEEDDSERVVLVLLGRKRQSVCTTLLSGKSPLSEGEPDACSPCRPFIIAQFQSRRPVFSRLLPRG